jgi:hypothetical protein
MIKPKTMKQILVALAISAFAFAGAQAQTSCVCKAKHPKPKKVCHKAAIRKPKQEVVACRQLPYKVCRINPDRRSVSCYQSTDLTNLTPLNNAVTTYGPTGPLPDEVQKQKVKTIVNSIPKHDFCYRDEANKQTVCNYVGRTIFRDANGFYSYRVLPQEGKIDIQEPSSVPY